MLSSSDTTVPRMANIRSVLAIYSATLTISLILSGAFAFLPRSSMSRAHRSISLFVENSSSSENFQGKNQQQEQDYLFGSGADSDLSNDLPSDDQISSLLNRKIKELNLGIGKRYITRTQRGFLNVHYEPSDPYMVENVVNQLSDGQIVTATGPKRGIWIPHDGGGWSVSKYEGFTWLEPIDE